MRKIFYIFILIVLANCNNSLEKNKFEQLFNDNQKEFIDFKSSAFTNFEDIVNSDECYPEVDKSRITITLKYLENCNSSLSKELFDEISIFFTQFSIESIYLERNKLVLLMKVSSNIEKTKSNMIVFSQNDSLPVSHSENIVFKKEIYKNWYYLIQEESSF